jgi:hypothetical protein
MYGENEKAAQKRWREAHKDDEKYKERQRKSASNHYRKIKESEPEVYQEYLRSSRLRYWRKLQKFDPLGFERGMDRMKNRNGEMFQFLHERLVEINV